MRYGILQRTHLKKKKCADLLQTVSTVSCYNAQICCYVTKTYDFAIEAKIYSNSWAIQLDKNTYCVLCIP